MDLRTPSYAILKISTILLLLSTICFTIPHSQETSALIEKEFDVDAFADAQISASNPDTTYGMEPNLTLSQQGGVHEEMIYLKFNLTGLEPYKRSLISAAITVKIKGENGTENLLIGLYVCGLIWVESTITWNNAPEMSTLPQEKNRGDYDQGLYIFDDYTDSLVKNALYNLGLLTVVLKSEENGTQSFWSRHDQDSEAMTAHLHVVYYAPGGEESTVDTTSEYSSGYLPEEGFWYTWINTSKTQIIYLVAAAKIHSHYFPSWNFLGQRFKTADGTEMIIGHVLMGYELFDDTNGNGVLDANFDTGVTETSYYLTFNFSQAFTPTIVEKTWINDSWHYRWTVRYEGVLGFLNYPDGSRPTVGDSAAMIEVAHLETSYDYFLTGNVSMLKTSLDLGELTDFISWDENVTSIEGFGLTALHSALLIACSEKTQILINGEEYNTNMALTPMPEANIASHNGQLYDLLFDENYTLYENSTMSYPAPSSAVPWTSFPPLIREGQAQFVLGSFKEFLNDFFTSLTGLSLDLNLNYTTSSLLYRVNYHKWDGYRLVHDPTYVAHLQKVNNLQSIDDAFTFEILLLALGSSIVIFWKKKKHKNK
ncbi:MAG: DNRLRE domain-containing protein [Candidatus Hermodarchaeota archaeon]